MTRPSLLMAIVLLPAVIAAAAAPPTGSPPPITTEARLCGATLGIAATDSTLLIGPWGSGAPHNGQFETAGGGPAWNGWTSLDLTEKFISHWHVDTYNVVSGVYSAWCGDDFPACHAGDVDGGYGSNWYDGLVWRGPVTDPALPCTVRVQAVANIDVEPGEDYFRLLAIRPGADVATFGQWSLRQMGAVIDVFHVYQPGEYVGAGADEVGIDFRVSSDGAWDDEDCRWGTAGAVQLDDVVITLSNGTGYSHDFEDGTLGAFTIHPEQGLGDFAAIHMHLRDLDPCAANPTPQMTFIDDGVVMPGTGGSPCLDWCYGQGGWIVHPGGDPYVREEMIWNVAVSPALALPPGTDGLRVDYDAYLHNDIDWSCWDASCPSHVLSYRNIRSVATGDPADLEETPWARPDRLTWSPDGDYRRDTWDFSDVLVPGATHAQLALGVYDYDAALGGGYGRNGTPAPYYDNVRLTAYVQPGPAISAASSDLARDGFPAQGHVDLADLGTNSVRFDMIDGSIGTGTFVPYDSLLVNIVPRPGAVVSGAPRLHYRLFRNEIFDPYRSAGLPDEGFADLVDQGGSSWTVDLPDEGFLFPGDRIHYCFSATDDLNGDERTSILPADTTGFSRRQRTTVFAFPYDPAFTVRALPAVLEDDLPGTYRTPTTLLWHDSGTRDDWDEWLGAIHQAFAWLEGENYDIFDAKTVHGDGRALRAGATVDHLGVYDQVLYAGGLDDTGLEADLPLVESWLQFGNRNLFLSGHRIAGDLDGAFSAWTGTAVAGDDLRLLVGGQMAPRVQTVVGTPVLATVANWLAFGECPEMAPATAITTTGAGVSAAQYLDPAGNPDLYPYAALVLGADAGTGSRVVTLPWDFAHVHTDPDEGSKLNATDAARVRMLHDILAYFGVGYGSEGILVGTLLADAFVVKPYPNPFNPSTTVSYSIKEPGHLSLRVFDPRGALVTTLVDGRVEQSGSVAWHGRDDAGAQVASGVYFYEARMGDDVQVGKLALLK